MDSEPSKTLLYTRLANWHVGDTSAHWSLSVLGGSGSFSHTHGTRTPSTHSGPGCTHQPPPHPLHPCLPLLQQVHLLLPKRLGTTHPCSHWREAVQVSSLQLQSATQGSHEIPPFPQAWRNLTIWFKRDKVLVEKIKGHIAEF